MIERKQQHRFIKLQPLHRNYNYKPVPFLRLSGKWLQQAGFCIDSTVSVTVEDNLLVIRPIEEETNTKQ